MVCPNEQVCSFIIKKAEYLFDFRFSFTMLIATGYLSLSKIGRASDERSLPR